MALLTFGFAIVSCSDKEADSGAGYVDPVDSVKTDSVADYTIIFWGMAGKLDMQTSFDLANVAYNYQQGRVGKNVNIAGLMKISASVAYPDLVDGSYDKTMYFDSKSIGTHAISKDDVDLERIKKLETDKEYVESIKKCYKEAFETLGGKEYADTLYPMNNVDSLANFIKATAKKFPARHYVLMTFGHGNGFSPVADTPLTTKTCVYDDYTDKRISADELVSAVQKSGIKVQTLFAQSCLVGTLENMAAYSQVFDYCLFSAESIYCLFYPEYLVKLSEAGDNEEKMVKASQDEVDYYVERIENLLGKGEAYTSNGFYNLRKASTLLAATKEAADWYTANYDSEADRDSINRAMMNTIVCEGLEDEDNAKNTDTLRATRAELQKLIGYDVADFDVDKFAELMTSTFKLFLNDNGFGFPMADLMRNTLKAGLPEEKTALLKTIYDKYMTALKDMAYIRTTSKPANAVADYEYIYASPTVNIFALNTDYFISPNIFALKYVISAFKDQDWDGLEKYMHLMLDGTTFASSISLEGATTNYTSSVFDQQVKWSNFLKKLTFNPSVVICPDRQEVSEKME